MALIRKGDGSDDGVRLYLDGVLEATGPSGSRTLSANSAVLIGASPGVVQNHKRYRGSIDDVAWFAGVLSEADIEVLQTTSVGHFLSRDSGAKE